MLARGALRTAHTNTLENYSCCMGCRLPTCKACLWWSYLAWPSLDAWYCHATCSAAFGAILCCGPQSGSTSIAAETPPLVVCSLIFSEGRLMHHRQHPSRSLTFAGMGSSTSSHCDTRTVLTHGAAAIRLLASADSRTCSCLCPSVRARVVLQCV